MPLAILQGDTVQAVRAADALPVGKWTSGAITAKRDGGLTPFPEWPILSAVYCLYAAVPDAYPDADAANTQLREPR